MNQPQYPYPPHPGQYPPPPKKGGWGLGLVLLVVVLPAIGLVVGVLAVSSIYGVRKYISSAKEMEARNSLSQIGSLAKQAYARDGKVCPSATRRVPETETMVKALKYPSSPADWTRDDAAHAGFACLGFSLSQPQYYQYEYTATASGFRAIARGDLDGDGIVSVYELKGEVVGAELIVAPTLIETNPGE